MFGFVQKKRKRLCSECAIYRRLAISYGDARLSRPRVHVPHCNSALDKEGKGGPRLGGDMSLKNGSCGRN